MAVLVGVYEHTYVCGRLNSYVKRNIFNFLFVACLSFIALNSQSEAIANNKIEYQVKAAFIYNFIAFTHWPDSADKNMVLCIYGENDFLEEINKLQGKLVDNRQIKVEHIFNHQELKACQIIFFPESVNNNLSSILEEIQNEPILTLADSENAASQGVMINMDLVNNKIVFDINLEAARKSKLNISSKLLQLAAKVYQ